MSQEREALLREAEEIKFNGTLQVRDDEEKRYRVLKWIALVVLALSAIAQAIMLLVADCFSVFVESATLYRRGPNSAAAMAYPSSTVEPFQLLNTGVFMAVATAFAALGFALVLALNGKEIDQVSRGSDGYMWGSFMIGQMPLWLAVLVYTGSAGTWELTFATTLVFAWLGVFMLGDLLNQYFYRNMLDRADSGTWSWSFFLISGAIFIVFLVYLVVILWCTFFPSDSAIAAGAIAPPTLLIGVPITAVIIYLVFLGLLLAHYAGASSFRKSIDVVFALQIVQFVFALVVPWMAFGFNTAIAD